MGRRNCWTYEKLVACSLRDLQTGCIVWLRGRDSKGYGSTWDSNKSWRVHRLVWQLFNGPIPEEQVIRHSCHNPSCFVIEHLSVGTHLDNMRDMREAGRSFRPYGELAHGACTAKLSESDVRQIKSLLVKGVKNADIAREFNVHRGTISAIKMKKSWGHIA